MINGLPDLFAIGGTIRASPTQAGIGWITQTVGATLVIAAGKHHLHEMDSQIDRLKSALAQRYEIVRELGAGGMATVYLAEDVRHRRRVAVKVLRPELAAILGGERFLKEIEVTANLQHPNILPLYDSGDADGLLYYVMPFIEGESLRDKLNREKQLSIDETIAIGRAVAAALSYAHERNIIHRDIKPENILMQSGQALVADFGIALAVSEAGGQRLTETGLSLGTPHYMSPEQASGDRELDGRSDQYSLAATLYEALAGEPPFNAPSTQAIVAKILTEQPPFATDTRATVPEHTAFAIQKALEKLPADRFQTATEFAEALTHPGKLTGSWTAEHARPHGAEPARSRTHRMLPWLVAIAALLLAAVAMLWPNTPVNDSNVVEFAVRTEQPMNQAFALSRDGRHLAISSARGSMLLRSMNSVATTAVPASRDRVWGQPVFSPDADWIAYVDVQEGEMQRVPTTGGTPVTIAKIPLLLFGLTWGPRDTIIWGRGFSGLWAVPVEGGTPQQLTVPDTSRGEVGHWHPQHLPGGTKVLFSTYRAPFDSTSVELLDLETGERTVLFRGGAHARYVPTGHIAYSRGETLWTIPFDLDRSRVTGPGSPARDGVSYDPTNARGGFDISDNGTLVYMTASVWNSEAELMWVDLRGSEQPFTSEPGVFAEPAISPDRSRIAVVRTVQGEPDLWVYEVDRPDAPTRITRGAGLVAQPVWAPNSREVLYSSERRLFELVRRDWEAGAPEMPVLLADGPLSGTDLYAYAFTPDDRIIVGSQGGSWDIWSVPLDGSGEPLPYRVTEFHEREPVISPDGRWMAYVSTETGPAEIWLQPYPSPDATRRRRQITRNGGDAPLWGRSGELFYRDGQRVMSVRIDLATGTPAVPVELFSGPYMPGANYAFDRAGQRFLMIKQRETTSWRREMVVVLNWARDLDGTTLNR